MINHQPRILPASVAVRPAAIGVQGDQGDRVRMIRASRVTGSASPADRTIVIGLALAVLLAALGGCAAGNATSSLATPATASATPSTTTAATAPTQPAAAAPAPAAPPQHLTATEINEKCWMRTEKFKSDNLDKRMKLVDKCVEEMTRAQGGV